MNARRRPLISGTALAGATALGLLALTGCGSGDGSSTEAAEDGKVNVVASFYPMEFLAEEVGGEHVEVSTITGPGVDPHDLELGPQQVAELGEAGLVVYLQGLQPAVDDAVEQSGAEHVAEVSALTTPAEDAGHAQEEEHAEEGHDHGEEGHAEEDGHDHAEDGHDHGHDHEGGEDPHLWLDPVQYAQAAEGVGEALAEADPDHAADYRKNAGELAERLSGLDTEFSEGLANTETTTFITTHAAFGHLAARYGLDEESIAGLSPEAEPSAARVRELHDLAARENVSTVFFETLASDRTAKSLAGDLDLRTDVLDPLEGITDASRGDDYFSVMRANLDALRTALGAR
ncbi:metal ABC transporter substrate-binding protein [Streptomyces sp. TRM 70351]|uniref:metal ABC transporter substrate-binding protein n=1 Tax=Streptomyces sp. TRM 70351 TaxID=3116552 RepID=UPI002E7B4ECC|nr:metal ABC transporter substrate-binding protein [Streptomyces sp. TRM 70351]MEE1928442.1 metal ABC transporter substrate-binding protein [Streptomyces sp. TRM 70351]